MNPTRALLAGAALAGSLLAGGLAAPAATAATVPAAAPVPAAPLSAPAVSAALGGKHFFGPYHSAFGGGESFGKRSYFKGYWVKTGGRYWFYGDLVDRDRDRHYSYVWFRWHDRSGHHTKVFKTFRHAGFAEFGGFRTSKGFDDFKIRVCEGTDKFDDCGGWGDAF
ncbi:hypothetical protein FHS43_000640 [Streptosporangium becharense]|uniref:Uncharacterized protein n=1 Tax=Streptosporangium becharense TaxID=1816182 RepID=A0A7W9IF94_9ACTN|nr:hypothetical protein [Streptosporangium becharense]MBB2909394.1 hypothetical protein [Streptosporangium becharense]MBB5819649.1 hypothetical protein [Streptosporangium becharense]